MQMNPTELVASRIYFQAIEPGATQCARHSPTPFVARHSFPILLWIRCLQVLLHFAAGMAYTRLGTLQ